MTDQSSTFESLAERFTNELRAGDQPSISAYAAAHPDQADTIRRLFPVLEMMEDHQTPVDDFSEEGLMEAELAQLKSTPPMRRLGDYHIVREIGRGGMGIVFEAQQESLDRRVALKLLPDSAQLDQRRLARFEQEAKASAMLHHTNIVPIFGVGTHGDTSYFVMQYIDGEPLNHVLSEISRLRSPQQEIQSQATEANAVAAASTFAEVLCNSESWPTSDAKNEIPAPELESSSEISASFSQSDSGVASDSTYWRNIARIGTQVADALDHAHKKRILHRDIKPSNLMIDQTGCAWVTDFGLAKYFESPDLTQTGEVVGTLRYMSPEQLNGKADERSDIFGLGLTLYEMAALQPAYNASDRKQLMKQVIDASPTPLRTIDRRIPRDLDTIVQKCVANDPNRRYGSAREVADDLQRFLDGEPVIARRINVGQRIAKWCRRRPAVATLLAALFLSLTVGIAGVVWQWHKTSDALVLANRNLDEANRQTGIARRQRAIATRQSIIAQRQRSVAVIQKNKANHQKAMAQKHFKQARESVNRFFTVISQQRLLQEPGLQPLRKELLQEALNYHEQFVAQYRDDEELKFELGISIYQIAEIESLLSGNPSIAKSLDEPIQIFTELCENDPTNPDARLWLARAYGIKSNLLARFDFAKALQYAKDSITELERLRAEFPDENYGLDELARQYQMLGLAYESIDRASQRTDRTLDFYGKSYAIRSQIHADNPDDVEHAVFLADITRDLGITYRRMAEFEKAEEHYERALDILRPLVEKNPNHMLARRTLASIAVTVGFFFGSGKTEKDYDKALSYYHLAEQNYSALATQNPLIIEYQDGLARSLSNSGGVYQVLDQLEKALEYRIRAAKIREKLSLANPNAIFISSGWAVSLNGVGSALRDMERYKESLEYHTKAHEVHLQTIALDPRQTVLRLRLISGLVQQTRTEAAAGNFQTAVDLIAQFKDHVPPNFPKARYQMGVEYTITSAKIGRHLTSLESSDESLTELRKNSLNLAKKSFQEAADLGFPVTRQIKMESAFGPDIVRPENVQIREWIEETLGKK